MENSKQAESFTWFEIVQTEWREQYDREWGYGMILVVAQESTNNRYWLMEIGKDKDGWYTTNRIETRSANRLQKTNKNLMALDIEVRDKVIKL